MPEHRRKENDERKKKAKLWKGEVQKENREHKHTKKWEGSLKISL